MVWPCTRPHKIVPPNAYTKQQQQQQQRCEQVLGAEHVAGSSPECVWFRSPPRPCGQTTCAPPITRHISTLLLSSHCLSVTCPARQRTARPSPALAICNTRYHTRTHTVSIIVSKLLTNVFFLLIT